MVEAEQTEQEEAEASYLKESFKINPERLAAQGRSFELLLLHRRCASCWGSMVQRSDGGHGIKAAEHLKQIAKHCSAAPDFIHTEMPLMEGIFRLLLTNGLKPMTTQVIYEEMQERWVDPVNPRIPSPEGVYRTLRSDAFYGISEVDSKES